MNNYNFTSNQLSLPGINKRLDNLETSCETSFGDVRERFDLLDRDIDDAYNAVSRMDRENRDKIRAAKEQVSKLEARVSVLEYNVKHMFVLSGMLAFISGASLFFSLFGKI